MILTVLMITLETETKGQLIQLLKYAKRDDGWTTGSTRLGALVRFSQPAAIQFYKKKKKWTNERKPLNWKQGHGRTMSTEAEEDRLRFCSSSSYFGL